MKVNDSNIEITGKSGYGALSIGDCCIDFDNSTVKAADYGMIMLMGKGSGSFKNGTVVNSGRFATMSSMNTGVLEVNNATLNTGETTFVVRGCSTEFKVSNATLNPGNGIILQVMNGDDPGNPKGYYKDPTEPDEPIEDRDLTTAVAGTDVVASFADMTLKGNIYNGSCENKGDTGGANLLSGGPGAGGPPMGGGAPGGMPPMGGGMPPMGGGAPGGMPAGGPPAGFSMPEGGFPGMGGGAPGGMPAGGPPMGGGFPGMGGGAPGGMPAGGPPMGGGAPGAGGPPMGGFSMPSFGGPNVKNLSVSFQNVDYTGCITASVSKHRVEKVCKENCEELGEVINYPEAAINNGVIVSLDEKSVWTVTDTCYLTALTIAEGAVVKASSFTVDGEEKALVAGEYTGKIVLKA